MSLLSTYRFLKWRKNNSILQTIDQIKNHKLFKRSRIDFFIPQQTPTNVVVLLGQVHTVWKGKIGNRERNMIVKCQARLCSYYAFFEEYTGVRQFGGEGMYEGLNTSFHDKRNFELYEAVEKNLQLRHPVPVEFLSQTAEKILRELGKEWHRELRSQADQEKIQRYASAVSGQSLFNYLRDGDIGMYPVEGEKEYQQVLEGISLLGHQIEKLEQTEEMKSVRSRGGKIKHEKEAQMVLEFNSLVREFNRLIGSDIRERATFEILRKKGKEEPVVVFTMGVGHRKNYLSLMKEYFGKSQTAFVFITPPELLINWWLAIGIPFAILVAVLWLNWVI